MAVDNLKDKAFRVLGLSMLVWLSGILGYLALASGFRLPARTPHPDELFGMLLYGAMHATPALVGFWILCVPVASAVQRLRCRNYGWIVAATALVCSVVLSGAIVMLCSALPGCSSRERLAFGALFAIVGLGGGLGFAWIYRPGVRP